MGRPARLPLTFSIPSALEVARRGQTCRALPRMQGQQISVAGEDQVSLAVHKQGADGNAGIEVAREIGVEYGAPIDASTHGFEFFDDLHGAHFRRSAEGACWKTRGECIESIQVFA